MLLFDTETFNIGSKQYIWEFAGIDTKTLQTFHYFNGYAIRQALQAKCTSKPLMFFNRYQLKHASKYIWYEKQDFIDNIEYCLHSYKTLTAYNIGFDAGVIRRLGFILDGYKLLDLWGSFVKIIGCTQKYILWCNANGYLTKTKLPKTDAETAYKYIAGIRDFRTPHLAIEDIQHELVIYRKLQATKKAKYYGFFGYSELKKYYN